MERTAAGSTVDVTRSAFFFAFYYFFPTGERTPL